MKTTLTALAAILAAVPAFAGQDYKAVIAQMVEDSLRADIATPQVIAAIEEQNVEHAGIDQARIDALDSQWVAELAAGGGPLITETMANATSDYLKTVQAKYNGLITEIFVVDNLGLNVGQSERTSDYWQGDEAKFQKTYPFGADAVFVDDVDLDESTQTMQSQVSFTLVDASGAPIGAVTIGVNVDALLN